MWFCLQGEMRYEITGYYPAQSFFAIHPTTGVVNISQDLRLDSLKLGVYKVSHSKGWLYVLVSSLLRLKFTCRVELAQIGWISTEIQSHG